jgi:hypothetical protein
VCCFGCAHSATRPAMESVGTVPSPATERRPWLVVAIRRPTRAGFSALPPRRVRAANPSELSGTTPRPVGRGPIRVEQLLPAEPFPARSVHGQAPSDPACGVAVPVEIPLPVERTPTCGDAPEDIPTCGDTPACGDNSASGMLLLVRAHLVWRPLPIKTPRLMKISLPGLDTLPNRGQTPCTRSYRHRDGAA